jgi:hypothetical protein
LRTEAVQYAAQPIAAKIDALQQCIVAQFVTQVTAGGGKNKKLL